MNRQQRRALARKQAQVPMVKVGLLTIPEAEVVAEALDQYALHLQDVGLEGERVWAHARAVAIRELLQASIDGRPAYDEHGEREAG